MFLDIFGTVSYTHLDVYKRQPPWLLHLRGVPHSLVHGLCTCYAVYEIVKVLLKEENLSFLLTLTKRAKNERTKRNFFKNTLPAASDRAGYYRGRGLGLHLSLIHIYVGIR